MAGRLRPRCGRRASPIAIAGARLELPGTGGTAQALPCRHRSVCLPRGAMAQWSGLFVYPFACGFANGFPRVALFPSVRGWFRGSVEVYALSSTFAFDGESFGSRGRDFPAGGGPRGTFLSRHIAEPAGESTGESRGPGDRVDPVWPVALSPRGTLRLEVHPAGRGPRHFLRASLAGAP